ncbi:hypothetical protein AB0K27_05805 [Micromonospora echinospora]|uniref:Uncharacterized protein n=1 Tax=Micromonospora echinospora TaxID=1877 RepID=A0ABR6MHL8_MICEC|nr:hypothetical protein [Micromonospora echinospora]MBB5114868.1 hypothetical protein [Micromonospora echinospora]
MPQLRKQIAAFDVANLPKNIVDQLGYHQGPGIANAPKLFGDSLEVDSE